MTRALISAAVAVATLTFGCGSDDEAFTTAPDPMEMPNGAEPLALNGCDTDSYVDGSADDAERVVQIGADGLKFTPPCLQIASGQTVTFEGSLTAHPIAPGNPDDAAAGSAKSPIEAVSTGRSVAFTFDSAGTFPYYCELHAFGAGMGMAGAIYVR
jgi:plastocyanin